MCSAVCLVCSLVVFCFVRQNNEATTECGAGSAALLWVWRHRGRSGVRVWTLPMKWMIPLLFRRRKARAMNPQMYTQRDAQRSAQIKGWLIRPVSDLHWLQQHSHTCSLGPGRQMRWHGPICKKISATKNTESPGEDTPPSPKDLFCCFFCYWQSQENLQ